MKKALACVLMLFSTMAWADEAVSVQGQGAGQEAISQTLMLGGLFVVFYFMLIRPQNKRAKAHQQLLTKLQEGDEIVTIGGVMGRIRAIVDQIVTLSVASGVDVQVQKSSIAQALPKGTLKHYA